MISDNLGSFAIRPEENDRNATGERLEDLRRHSSSKRVGALKAHKCKITVGVEPLELFLGQAMQKVDGRVFRLYEIFNFAPSRPLSY